MESGKIRRNYLAGSVAETIDKKYLMPESFLLTITNFSWFYAHFLSVPFNPIRVSSINRPVYLGRVNEIYGSYQLDNG